MPRCLHYEQSKLVLHLLLSGRTCILTRVLFCRWFVALPRLPTSAMRQPPRSVTNELTLSPFRLAHLHVSRRESSEYFQQCSVQRVMRLRANDLDLLPA